MPRAAVPRGPQGLWGFQAARVGEPRAVEWGSAFSPVPTLVLLSCGSELLAAPWREPDTESGAKGTLCSFFFSRNPNNACFLTFHAGMLLGLQAASAKPRVRDGRGAGVVSNWG